MTRSITKAFTGFQKHLATIIFSFTFLLPPCTNHIKIYQLCHDSRFRGSVCWAPAMENSFQIANSCQIFIRSNRISMNRRNPDFVCLYGPLLQNLLISLNSGKIRCIQVSSGKFRLVYVNSDNLR